VPEPKRCYLCGRVYPCRTCGGFCYVVEPPCLSDIMRGEDPSPRPDACPGCNGTGWGRGDPCTVCHGTGQNQDTTVFNLSECPHCRPAKGKRRGTSPSVLCPSCKEKNAGA